MKPQKPPAQEPDGLFEVMGWTAPAPRHHFNPQVAGDFGLMVYAVDVGEYRRIPKNGRLLTGDYLC